MATAATAARAREGRRKPATATATPFSPSQTSVERIDIRPQPGPQERALACTADILIYGGAAGGGKSYTLLLEPTYHYTVPMFRAVIFRRIMPNITNAGGLWDESKAIYPYLQGKPNESGYHWTFPSGARLEFAGLQYESTCLDWQGAQIALLGFDQLEEFTEYQFWFMTSRLRSMTGITPYVRATVNPVPADDEIGGWVHRLISWWINEETGLPIPERDGVIRWFFRPHEALEWFDTKADGIAAAMKAGFTEERAKTLVQSCTFIGAKLEDNQRLMTTNPAYWARLMNLPMVERERLLGGNWNVKPSAGKIFNRAWFELVTAAPTDCRWVRYWDKAGTEGGGAYTAGVKMGHSPSTKRFYVGHVCRGQWAEAEREAMIKQMAVLDGRECQVVVEQEPGSSGKEQARHTVINLAGYSAYADKVTGDKYTRAKPFAAMVQARNVSLVAGEWNEAYLAELHGFSPDGNGYKDQVDGSSGSFNKLAGVRPLELLNVERIITPEEQEVARLESGRQFTTQVASQGLYWPGE